MSVRRRLEPGAEPEGERAGLKMGGDLRNTLRTLVLMSLAAEASAGQPVRIVAARGTAREEATRARLEEILGAYDLTRYTFTREVVIEEGARNHAFPVLTLNARFADSSDDLLASYVHEQVHWHLRQHDRRQREAVAELRRMYPGAPTSLPEGAESAYSTYGHLVTCYLEVQAMRRLTGRERAAGVLSRKSHYLWIYKTVISDEKRISLVVRGHGLELE